MTAAGSYSQLVLYGPPSKPERPTLTQNNDQTVTVSWTRPVPLNDLDTTSIKYKLEVLHKDNTTWVDILGTTFDSTLATPSTSFTMTVLKTKSTYTSTENGQAIKIRVTATNSYGTSSASEENLPSAVYQGVPSAYTGAYTIVKGTTSATISWENVDAADKYGYSPITGWAYGYKKTADASYTIVTQTTRSVTLTLDANTEY